MFGRKYWLETPLSEHSAQKHWSEASGLVRLPGSLAQPTPGVVTHVTEVNGQLALVGYLDEKPVGAILLQIEGEQITRLYYVVNPEKLTWL